MVGKYEDIELGALVTRVIKNALYIDKPWIDCYKSVASDFSKLKSIASEQHKDKTKIELLQWLGQYDENDIRDVLA
jgi:hypothetical protein